MACHACRVYEERPALVPELGGALVWHVEAVGSRRVLPDGCMDLIWADGTLLVAGADTGPVVLDTGPRMRPFTGVRFAPGDGPDVLGVPAHELTDRRVPLAALWPQRRVRELTERVAAAADPGTALEALAAARLRALGPREEWQAAAVAALRAGCGVRETAARLGLSERQLRRRSLAAFGYGPKTLARVLRLERALRLARCGVSGAETAARAGYADQAHLAREVRALTGLSLSLCLSSPSSPSSASPSSPSSWGAAAAHLAAGRGGRSGGEAGEEGREKRTRAAGVRGPAERGGQEASGANRSTVLPSGSRTTA